jgi:hypothetical protein
VFRTENTSKSGFHCLAFIEGSIALQRPMFYLRESVASATNVFYSESKAAATKRSVGTEIKPRFVESHTLFNMLP